MRSKEDAHDYRYFPDPDIPPVVISEAYLEQIKAELPDLPWQVRADLTKRFSLSDYDVELLSQEWTTAEFYEALCTETTAFKSAANLVINKLLPWAKEKNAALSEFPLNVHQLAAFIQLIEDGLVSHSVAYQQLFPALLSKPAANPAALAEQLQLIQSQNADELTAWVEEVIAAYPDKVKAYQKGKKGLIGFFMGEVMKRSKGQAEPKQTNALLRERLAK